MAVISGNLADGKPMQLGGWYNGRQWNGSSLGAPGVETIGANAGKAVSNEVIAQTNPANVGYVAEQKQTYQTPSTKEQVNPYLANVQDSIYNSANSPETKIPTMEQLKSELSPSGGAPAPINRVETFNTLRTSYGVADLEKSLSDINLQIQTEQDSLSKQRGIEEGKTVPLGVISGRVTEEERVAQNRLRDLERSKSVITDELNTKYNIISTLVTYQGLDYQDAVTAYDKEFNRNLQIYDIISTKQDKAETAARANLQIYANAVMAGNIDYNGLSADQKLMIQKLEIQSGLPAGFISSIKKDPKADILFTSTDNGVTQVGIRNADGTISVQSYGKSTKTASESDKKAMAISDMTRTLNEMGGNDYLVSPEQYKEARSVWLRAGYDAEEFDKLYSNQYVDYSHYKDYGVEAPSSYRPSSGQIIINQ